MKKLICILIFLMMNLVGCANIDLCVVARSLVDASLPIVLSRNKNDNKFEHFKEASLAINIVIKDIEGKENIKIKELNSTLNSLKLNLKDEEIYAIQGGLKLIVSLIQSQIEKDSVGSKVINVIICLLDETSVIFRKFGSKNNNLKFKHKKLGIYRKKN